MGYYLLLLGSIVYVGNHHAMLSLDLERNPPAPSPSHFKAFLLCTDQQWHSKIQQCGWETSASDSELKSHSMSLFTGQSLGKFLLPFGLSITVDNAWVVILLAYYSASLVLRLM